MHQTGIIDRYKEEQAYETERDKISLAADPVVAYMTKAQIDKSIVKLRKEMENAAKDLDFIEAARLRDEIFALQGIRAKK